MREILLTQGFIAQIDDCDYEQVSALRWWPIKGPNTVYAYTNLSSNPRKPVLLHRFITNAPAGVYVDHRDRDGLNCQRDNLRFCTAAQNHQNMKKNRSSTSPYKGTHWNKEKCKWEARIRVNRKALFLGYYASPEAGARAYDAAARKYFGEFARLNFPEESHDIE